MIQNPKYESAFQAGYRQGLAAGLDGSKAKIIMTHDLIFAYGVMAIILKEKRHWKQKTIESLIGEIQNEWFHLTEGRESERETMVQMVERRTGIQLQQMAQDIVNDAGNDKLGGAYDR